MQDTNLSPDIISLTQQLQQERQAREVAENQARELKRQLAASQKAAKRMNSSIAGLTQESGALRAVRD
jgi:chromosome segregation ATPase